MDVNAELISCSWYRDPHDVLRNEAGRTILEQPATVIILRLGEAALEAIRGIYNLSEAEEQALLETKLGEGILRAGSYKLSVYVQPTREELREFSTRPVWVFPIVFIVYCIVFSYCFLYRDS